MTRPFQLASGATLRLFVRRTGAPSRASTRLAKDFTVAAPRSMRTTSPHWATPSVSNATVSPSRRKVERPDTR